MAKIAIITRTKDRSVFLKRAIKSVANQSYKDYVHVIVNDGGKNGAIETIIDAQSDDVKSKIKLFHRSEPSNAPDTIFSESIDRVDSTYVAIHDDDDTWHVDFLQKTAELLDNNPELAGVVVKTDKVTEKVSGDNIELIKTEPWMPSMQVISLYRQCIDNQLTPISFLFRRDAYENVGKFRSDLPVVGDWEFGIRLLQKYDVGFLDHEPVLARYHHRNNAKDNSFANHSHRKYVTLVANEYLRDELRRGVFGVGYIMSDLKYRQDDRNDFIKKFVPSRILGIIKRK